jgi:hypothetical protein
MKACPFCFEFDPPTCKKDLCLAYVPAHTETEFDTEFHPGCYFPTPKYKRVVKPAYCTLLKVEVKP